MCGVRRPAHNTSLAAATHPSCGAEHPHPAIRPLEVIPMRFASFRFRAVWFAVLCTAFVSTTAFAWDQAGWDGKRHVSYQQQKDLFYNYYAQPGPFNGAAAQLYVSPRPVPPFVGHTWVTYQPFYPHEFMYR